MSTPIVMIATVNTGLPTMGRSAVRSMTSPRPATSSIASGSAIRNGQSNTVARNTTAVAPTTMSAGCAKLTTFVDL